MACLTTFLACAYLTRCGPAQPCADNDCGDDLADGSPCGGADLPTDNNNCGECDNVCEVNFEDTPYAAGGCQNGECGVQWGFCDQQRYETCEDFCEAFQMTCRLQACGGRTGLVLSGNPFMPGCLRLRQPYGEMAGSCDEPIPWHP